jgi:hypothetical protein
MFELNGQVIGAFAPAPTEPSYLQRRHTPQRQNRNQQAQHATARLRDFAFAIVPASQMSFQFDATNHQYLFDNCSGPL